MSTDYKDTQKVIEHMAAAKRVMNSHKGAIEDMAPEQLINKLKEEVDELDAALSTNGLMHTIEEAPDVYNFLMAIVHKKVLQYRGRKNVENPRNS